MGDSSGSAAAISIRRFEFFDKDTEDDIRDYSLKHTGYVKMRLQVGG